MDDLLSNFAQQEIESPTVEGYKYHFLNGSPIGSEYGRPIHPAGSTSARPINDDPFFDIQAAASHALHQATRDENEDEMDYNADIEEDDYEDVRVEASPLESYHEDPITGASYIEKSEDCDRSFHDKKYHMFGSNVVNGKASFRNVEPSLASSDGEQKMDDLAQQLRRLQGQDRERDELLTSLHQEIIRLKKILEEKAPDARAKSAELRFHEIRKASEKNPYACAIIDGSGYKIHERFLRGGKNGGIEVANRLWHEVSDYLQQHGNVETWEIMVHLYIDVDGLLARCVSNNIPLSDRSVRGFMLGFTQSQPLFTIVDVGRDAEKLTQKVEAMFHLFAKNVQCKHLIFGCCHNGAYAVALEEYASSPIAAAKITLLKSYETDTVLEDLPFASEEFSSVFRSKLTGGVNDLQGLPQQPGSDNLTGDAEKSSASQIAENDEAIAKWQATTNASTPIPARARPLAKVNSSWGTGNNVLLNINDERVDGDLGKVDSETSKSMRNRLETQHFCGPYHLNGYRNCPGKSSTKPCKYRHGPKLSDNELRFLKKNFRRVACDYGSECRRPDCFHGHVCPYQPICKKGVECPLSRFHDVDKTIFRLWSPEKTVTPRKSGKHLVK